MATNATLTLQLRDPSTGHLFLDDETGEPAELYLLAPDHPDMRAYSRRLTTSLIERCREKGWASLPSNEARRAETRLLARAIVGWRHIGEHGRVLDWSPDNAHYLLATYSVVRDQLYVFLQLRGLRALAHAG